MPSLYISELNKHISLLYAFARQVNELDFAASLGGEFRGAQDAGWPTTITAREVFEELSLHLNKSGPYSIAEYRVILLLYCQLAEAGGIYESLRNVMGVILLKPYLLWPFKDLVRMRKTPKRVIGPNANATFRDMATTAKDIGMSGLSTLLENAFSDEIRNGIAHADYVLWNDELRLRRRNGGNPMQLSNAEVGAAVTRGIGFFQILEGCNEHSMRSFRPAKTIVGRLSANLPMPWTFSFDPQCGSFSFSSSSPGPVVDAAYTQQEGINSRLDGKVLALYSNGMGPEAEELERYMSDKGFEPHSVTMDAGQLEALSDDVEPLGLSDNRQAIAQTGSTLLVSPWGFRWVSEPTDFDAILPAPLLDYALKPSPIDGVDTGEHAATDGSGHLH